MNKGSKNKIRVGLRCFMGKSLGRWIKYIFIEYKVEWELPKLHIYFILFTIYWNDRMIWTNFGDLVLANICSFCIVWIVGSRKKYFILHRPGQKFAYSSSKHKGRKYVIGDVLKFVRQNTNHILFFCRLAIDRLPWMIIDS